MTTKESATHKWLFPTRIRPNSFTWKSSSTAATRIKEAVAEIKTVSRNDPAAAAEGAVRLIERLSPALEHVDSSSGALGTAVNRAIETLVPIISAADVSIAVREKWLERLYDAHAADQVPYIEIMADFWGELCVTQELASAWADRMIGITRMALSPDKSLRGHYHGTTACLSALLHAGRYEDIYSLLAHTNFWHYKCYAVKGLAAEGKHDEAITLAESLRGPWTPDRAADRLCERILLESGRIEEAYRRFGLSAHTGGTYLATFREIAKAYPNIAREQILRDLIQRSPGDEGKWFAAAKELHMFDLALELVQDSPCDPKTLTRAARDHAEREPAFAEGAGIAALRWLSLGFGYEITALDVWSAYHAALKAAEALSRAEETKAIIRNLVAAERPDGFVRQVLGRELGLS
ncbi:MAG: hypothetical protein JWO52_6283 [Gammaproteobacteria bacterium]|nr:hypothetical protein [Gammaproteobacteria bacterium]